MSKLVLQMQMSADGFVGGEGQGAWQLWDWVGDCPWEPELRRDFNLFFQAIGTILLSRKMAQEGYTTTGRKRRNAFRRTASTPLHDGSPRSRRSC